MIYIQLCLAGITVFLTVLVWSYRKRPAKFPPGPYGVPLLGILPFLRKHPCVMYKKWSLQKYGPTMSIKLGTQHIVTLNTFDIINKVFANHGKISSDRATFKMFDEAFGQRGIIFRKYDEKYKAIRSFGLRALRGPDFDRAPKLQQEVNNKKAIEVLLLKASPKVLTKFFTCSLAHDATIGFSFACSIFGTMVGSGVLLSGWLGCKIFSWELFHKKTETIQLQNDTE